MDILQNLTNLLGQGAAPQGQQGGGDGGLGGLLDPKMLSGLVGSLLGGKGGAAQAASGAKSGGGMDLGGLLGSLMGGGGAGMLSSLLGGAEAPPAPQAAAPVDTLAQKRNENMLRALVYAAKADGRIDKQEEASINEQVQKMGLGAEAQAMVNQFLSEPTDPRKIAANITDSNEALQIFALSTALTQVDQPAEQQYIAALGQSLGIPANVQQSIVKRIFS